LPIFLFFIALVTANNNGVGLTPAMGYNTWNDFRCNINAADIKQAADAIVAQGLDKVGYKYVNMDDCWAAGRYSNGTVYPDAKGFPDGIKSVADYVHSKGLLFGIYTDRGTSTCAGRPGSYNYEKIDAQTYASWGVDYLKEDSCSASQDHNTAFAEYGKMRDALNATGRHIYFSLCGWNSWYAPVGWSLGNSWRIAGDCNDWGSVINAINTNAPLTSYARPGGWNDPDMLIGSSSNTAAHLTPNQSRTMFSLWSVMSAPLLIGSNVRNLSAWDLETYSNKEVIDVDQDPSGKQGVRLVGGDMTVGKEFGEPSASTINVWGKPLKNGDWVLTFLNNAKIDTDITCDAKCFQQMGFHATDTLQVRDLWKHQNIGTTKANAYTTHSVPKEGGSVTLRFSLTSQKKN